MAQYLATVSRVPLGPSRSWWIVSEQHPAATVSREEYDRMREELMRCGSLAVSNRVDGCVPKARADQIRRIVYRTCWPEETESNG